MVRLLFIEHPPFAFSTLFRIRLRLRSIHFPCFNLFQKRRQLENVLLYPKKRAKQRIF